LNKTKNMFLIMISLFLLIFLLSITTIAQNYDFNNSYEFNLSEHGPFFFEGINEFLGITFMVCFLVIILPIIISIVLGIWIYKDANKRGKEGIIWAILLFFVTLLLNYIGLIIVIIVWIAIRPPIGGTPESVASDRRCPNCGRSIPMDARACPYCAKKFENYF